jgi:NAD(P)-dependent dehydrogenase (short-subunit alcohol dehydrogenase family)
MDINKETVVLITGAGSGLGMATALRLAASGAKIVAIDINESGLAALEGQLSAEQFMGIRASVADSEEVSSAIDMAVSRYGALHVAVNCAGVADAAKTVSKGKPHPLDIWNKVINGF